MPVILAKPKTRAQQIRDLNPFDTVDFTLDEYNYIKSLISGHIAAQHPLRAFTVNKKENCTRVTRLEDAVI